MTVNELFKYVFHESLRILISNSYQEAALVLVFIKLIFKNLFEF